MGVFLSKRLLILYCIGNIDIFYVYIVIVCIYTNDYDQSLGLDNGYKKGHQYIKSKSTMSPWLHILN